VKFLVERTHPQISKLLKKKGNNRCLRIITLRYLGWRMVTMAWVGSRVVLPICDRTRHPFVHVLKGRIKDLRVVMRNATNIPAWLPFDDQEVVKKRWV
jgi:hypothetical protein